jgi:hypothetical protein
MLGDSGPQLPLAEKLNGAARAALGLGDKRLDALLPDWAKPEDFVGSPAVIVRDFGNSFRGQPAVALPFLR